MAAHGPSRPLSTGLSACLLAWLAGAAGQLQQAQLWPMPAYAALLALAMLLGLAALRGFAAPRGLQRSTLAALTLPVALAVLAFAWTGLLAHLRMQTLPPALEGRDLDVQGVVQAMPQKQDMGWRFRFQIEQAWWQGQPVQTPSTVYLGWYSASSRDDAFAGWPETVQAGERWRLRVRLKAAHGHLNPRGFDHELWLWEQGIRATGYVRQARGDPAPQRLGPSGRHPIEWMRQQVRDRLLARFAPSSAASGVAGILAALVTGDQAAIERNDWDIFRATGVSHLMSISGVHVTLLGWLVGLAVTALWRSSARWGGAGPLRWPAPTVGAWTGLAVAVAYAVFSGWGVPAQRTVWMLAVATVLRGSGRRWHWRHAWGLSAAVVVAVDPWALLQAGFWLSFVAVGVLLATDRPPAPRPEAALRTEAGRTLAVQTLLSWASLRRAAQWFWGLWREQALITLALLPLSVLFFAQFSLVGLLANLLAIPWVTLWVTPLALLGMLWPACWDLAAWSLQPLIGGLTALARWPLASVSLAMPPWPLAVLALVGACALVLRMPLSWRVWGLPLLLPALCWQPPRPAPGAFELLAADVGQGNAVLLRTARHSLLYDAGPRYSPESDAGHRVLLPLLSQLHERLDMLMLSHRDTDHTGGAQAVLAMQPQVALWSSLEAGHPLARRAGHQGCEAGRSWVWDGVRFELLHPQAGATRKTPSPPPNALSCVLRVQGRDGSALLAGDIEAPQERELLVQGLAPVDVLLVPHHGSKTSSSEAFLDALHPRMALVQAGYRNRFGHPAPAVAARYQERGIRWVESARCGAATWRSDAPDALDCERLLNRRYWHHTPEP
jgi:competence protein ComEC